MTREKLFEGFGEVDPRLLESVETPPPSRKGIWQRYGAAAACLLLAAAGSLWALGQRRTVPPPEPGGSSPAGELSRAEERRTPEPAPAAETEPTPAAETEPTPAAETRPQTEDPGGSVSSVPPRSGAAAETEPPATSPAEVLYNSPGGDPGAAPPAGEPFPSEPPVIYEYQVPGAAGGNGPPDLVWREWEDRARPVLIWKASEAPPASNGQADRMAPIQVGSALTGAELEALLPDPLPEGMTVRGEDCFAAFFLGDGSGGLAGITLALELTGPAERRVSLRIAPGDSPYYAPSCPVEPEPDASVNTAAGLEYTASQFSYLHGEGDPDRNPPQPWLLFRVEFSRGDAVYTVEAESPETEAEAVKSALAELVYAYARSAALPDLGAFQYRGE